MEVSSKMENKTQKDYEALLESKKKTCTKDRLLRTLSAIFTFDISEGEGGQIGYGYNEGYPGTGLRAPGLPLYQTPRSQRHAIIKHLLDNGLITGELDKDDKAYYRLKVTHLGKAVLEACCIDEYGYSMMWYRRHGYVQTGERSGFKTDGVFFSSPLLLIKEEMRRSILYPNAMSGTINISSKVGEVIKPKQGELKQKAPQSMEEIKSLRQQLRTDILKEKEEQEAEATKQREAELEIKRKKHEKKCKDPDYKLLFKKYGNADNFTIHTGFDFIDDLAKRFPDLSEKQMEWWYKKIEQVKSGEIDRLKEIEFKIYELSQLDDFELGGSKTREFLYSVKDQRNEGDEKCQD